MSHDRSQLINQLGGHLAQQPFNSVVIHIYCRSAKYFVDYFTRRHIDVEVATPENVSRYLRHAIWNFRQRVWGEFHSRRGGVKQAIAMLAPAI